MHPQKKKVQNTFGGLDTDTSINKYPEDKYVQCENFRLILNEDNTSYALVNIKGNKKVLDIPQNDYKVIGIGEFQNEIILFVLTGSQTKIYKLDKNKLDDDVDDDYDDDYDDEEFTSIDNIDDILTLDNNFTGFDINSILSIKCNEETDKLKKVYFTDGKNPLKVINVADPDLKDLDVNKFKFVPNLDFAPMELDLTTGSLKAGKVGYAYQLYNTYGSESYFSPVSELIDIYESPINLEVNKIRGSEIGTTTNKGVEISIGGHKHGREWVEKTINIPLIGEVTVRIPKATIEELDPIDQTFDRIRIVRIHYESDVVPPKVDVIGESSFSEGEFRFTDRGLPALKELTVEELNELLLNPIPKTLESKNNYLFLGNIKEEEVFDPDWSGVSIDVNFGIKELLIGKRQGAKHPFGSGVTADDTSYANPENASKYVGYQRGERYRFGLVGFDEKMSPSFVHPVNDDDIIFPTFRDSGDGFSWAISRIDWGTGQGETHGEDIYARALHPKFKVSNIPSSVKYLQFVRVERTPEQRSVVDCGVVSYLSAEDPPDHMDVVFEDEEPVKGLGLNFPVNPSINTAISGLFWENMSGSGRGDFISAHGKSYLEYTSPEILYENIDSSSYQLEHIANETSDGLPVYYEKTESSEDPEGWEMMIPGYAFVGYMTGKYAPSTDDYIILIRYNRWNYNSDYIGDKEYDILEQKINRYTQDISDSVTIGDIIVSNNTTYFSERAGNNFTEVREVDSDRKGVRGTCLLLKVDRNFGTQTDNSSRPVYGGLARRRKNLDSNNTKHFSKRAGDDFTEIWPVDSDRRGVRGTCLLLKVDRSFGTQTDNSSRPVYGGLARRRKNLDSNNKPINFYGQFQDCEFIPCSPVYSKDELEDNEVSVFGGDTYINYFDYLRGFWNESFGEKKKLMVNHGFITESSINLNIATSPTINTLATSSTNWKTSPYRIVQERKGEFHFAEDKKYEQDFDLYEYNRAYSRNNNAKKYFPRPKDIIFKKSNTTRTYYTDKKIDGEFSDRWLKVRPNNFIDLDNRYGDITRLFNFKDSLLAFQQEAVGFIPVEQRELMQTDTPGPLIAGTGEVVAPPDYISTQSGLMDYFGVVGSRHSLYYYDRKNNKIGRLEGEGINFISDMSSISSMLKNVKNNIHLAFNRQYSEVLFNLWDDRSLVYNEYMDDFTNEYLYGFKNNFNVGDSTFLVHPDSSLYKLGAGEYQDADRAMVRLIVNPQGNQIVIYDIIELTCEGYDSNNNLIADRTVDDIKIFNEYQQADISPQDLIQRFRTWRLNTLVGEDEDESRIRSSSIYVDLVFYPSNNEKLVLHDVITNIRPTKLY